MKNRPEESATSSDDPDFVSLSLVGLAQSGDSAAREEIFARLWPLSYRVARRMAGSDEDALDVVQDAFVKALLNLGQFDNRSTFRTWLLRIVTNTALDQLRSRQRKNRLFRLINWSASDEHGHPEPEITDDPSRGLHQNDLRIELDRAMGSLSHATRSAFVLYAEAGMTYQEVSETLGIPIGTVMSRIHAARQKLQVSLQDLYNSESSTQQDSQEPVQIRFRADGDSSRQIQIAFFAMIGPLLQRVIS